MHEAAAANGPAVAQRLLERVEHEAGMRRARGAPADDPSCECVDDEGDIDEAGPKSRRR
jgi:hypothetical protein